MRVDPALWRELERWAADDLRSVNGQIEFILREALRRRGARVADVGAAAEQQPEAGRGTGADEVTEEGSPR